MPYRNARVLLFGATGFIGRWVARLVPEEAQTYLIVRDFDASKKLLSAYGAHGTPVQIELTDFSELENFFSDIRPSIVLNLAGYGVDPKEKDAHLAKQINSELPRVLCELIKTYHDPTWPGQHLIHAGTALEYGTLKGILSEDLTPQPTTQYGITKLAGTNSILRSPLRTLVVRLFNVYGPGERVGRLLPSLLEIAGTEKDVALTAGTQKRDFTYVEDVARGWIQLGQVSEKQDCPINFATGQLHTVRQFVEIASRILQIQRNRLQFGQLPFRQEEMDHDGVSTERLQKLIKWTPSTSIEQGIEKTIAFLKSLAE